MAKIYLSSTSLKKSYKDGLARSLAYLGHDIIRDDLIEAGSSWDSYYRKAIADSDVFVFLVSNDLPDDSLTYDVFLQMRNYVGHSKAKLFIPVYLPNVSIQRLPSNISNIVGVKIEGETQRDIDTAAQTINISINSFLGKKLATEEKVQEIIEKIEKNAPKYIDETLKDLNKREKQLRLIALVCFCLGFLTLVCGVSVATWFANNGLRDFNGKENWSVTIYYAVKSIFIIVLLIAASKYSFNLAKAYMNESLKIADRSHAISFGKFYLQVLNKQIEPSELKEIFREWNINSQSSFIPEKSDDYDPKLLEHLTQLLSGIKPNKE